MAEALRIAHLTSVHPRDDTRILLKMCRSLVRSGHQVFLVVADGLGDHERDGVRIVDVGTSRGRLSRALGATRRVFTRALRLNADIYHLHDPELLPVGLALKRYGKHVIYDSHEDVPRDILSKTYIRPVLRRPIAGMANMAERFACCRLDAVVAATPAIRDKFIGMGISAVDVNNFPMLGELETGIAWSEKGKEVCYVGGIGSARGIRELVAAMSLLTSEARLNLAGAFSEAVTKSEVVTMPGWARVSELGFLSRSAIRSVFARSVAGIVTLHPTPAYVDSLPVKMFEYMSAGLPVIASDFPLWRDIVEGNDCGVCVDPLDPKAIAAAIDRLVENPDLVRSMGENGRRAVKERYNWGVEEKKLLELYRKLRPAA